MNSNLCRFLVILVAVSAMIAGCQKNETDPGVIIDNAIFIAGGDMYTRSSIEFDFRGKQYTVNRSDGNFIMTRKTTDSTGVILETYSNDGFKREVNGMVETISDSLATLKSNSINSVIYFALLPFKLNDDAVNKEYLGTRDINDKSYHKIKVTFEEEGGGKDHQDNFIYWIGTEDHKIDFLAYDYEVNGGGMRFREAYNERIVNGIRFVDHINYKPKEKGSIPLASIDDARETGKLKELSRIELTNIKVNTTE